MSDLALAGDAERLGYVGGAEPIWTDWFRQAAGRCGESGSGRPIEMDLNGFRLRAQGIRPPRGVRLGAFA